MLAPDANQFVLQDGDSNFPNYEGWNYFIDRVFPGAIMSMDDDTHRFQRKLMAAAFKKPAMEAFLAGMNLLFNMALINSSPVTGKIREDLIYTKRLYFKVCWLPYRTPVTYFI